MTDREIDQNKERSEVKTFPVPFTSVEVKENTNSNIRASSQITKKQLISKAIIYHQQGNLLEASKYYQRCIKHGINDYKVFSNYGLILKEVGKLKEAEILLRKAINLKDDNADVHFNLGLVYRILGKLEDARNCFIKAIDVEPNLVEAYLNLGLIFEDIGNKEKAEIIYRKAININPNFPDIYIKLSKILIDNDRLEEGEVLLKKAITIKPDFAGAYLNMGLIQRNLNKFQESEISLQKALQLDPNLDKAYLNLGLLHNDLGRYKEALKFTLKAIQINPKNPISLINLGMIYNNLNNIYQAEETTKKAIYINPNSSSAHFNIAEFQLKLGKFNEAKKSLKKSLDLEPEKIHRLSTFIIILQKLSCWDEIEAYKESIYKIGIEGKAINPMSLLYLEDNPLRELQRSIKFNNDLSIKISASFDYDKKEKINIGYFSSDFRNHAVSHLLVRILELHDKSKFQIYAYSLSNKNDNYTKRIKDAVFRFRGIYNLSNDEIIKQVREDKIDIAIDLNGFTNKNRISIFYQRLAPIQINYLGYPGSLGSKAYDYIIADRILIPEENKKFFIEKVIYHPTCFMPHDNTKKISNKIFTREELGLPIDGFVFTCFNAIQKITRREFNVWMRLLQKVEGSVLWLMKPHKSSIDNIYHELNRNKIDKEKIIFAERMNLDQHLSRHSCADLFLDTFNFNAGTTAADALWTGLPLITLIGKSYSARMAASVLNACNLNELVTTNVSDYESLAYEIATNKDKLNNLRIKIKNNIDCNFFDSEKFTLDLEELYIKAKESTANK